MKTKILFISIAVFIHFNIKADPLKPLPIDFIDKNKKKTQHKKSSSKKTLKKVKSYEELVKNMESIPGFFDFYIDKNTNKVYISINPNQFEVEFLMSLTRQSGDGYQFDGSSMQGQAIYFFKKVGEVVQLIEKNTKFRADEDRPISKSVANHIPNSIIASTKIIGSENKNSGAILIDANKFFLNDFVDVARRTNNQFSFDKENSYYNYIKSFPFNSEIDIYLHFKSKKARDRFTLASSKSMLHRYHISLSSLIDSDYIPRVEDDRVGYFTTIYQDYSYTLQEDPYVRYINRWNLKKANPNEILSKPIEPIVFWLENTIPHEFRDAVKEGILQWNKAFEKIGYIDAIEVKQMPDDAEWDPADVRYNTIRWLVHPESAYAVGPSRANPYTGELYDADIRVSNDYVRFYYDDFENYIDPLLNENYLENMWEEKHDYDEDHISELCNYGEYMKYKMAFAWSYLITNDILKDSEEDMEKFVRDGIIDLLLHEVGHTLGLRHNFKASSVFTLEQLSDSKFTDLYGVTGSVMDYNATNLMDGGDNYFQTQPGPYDYWAIEYGYSDTPLSAGITEPEWLESIASKSTDPWLAYGTDEDAFGSSTRSIDPLTSLRDMSSDPIGFSQYQIEIANKYWDGLLTNFEKDGERYPKLRSVFYQGLYEYSRASRNVPKFIGGIYHSRHHVGQETKELPMVVVSARDQKRALDFLLNNILGMDAFYFEPDFLNKLAPERYDDFTNRTWRMQRLDFPIHNIIRNLQRSTLIRIHNPRIIHRVHDNVLKTNKENDKLTVHELFDIVSDNLWIELNKFEPINSFRRETQSFYIDMLAKIYFDDENYFPRDTHSISYSTLRKIKMKISESLPYYIFEDETTSAHLRNMLKKIEAILDAQLVLE